MAISQIALQISVAISPFYLPAAQAATPPPDIKWYQSSNLTPEEQAQYRLQSERMATAANLIAQDKPGQAAAGMARSVAAGELGNAASGWLNQFGNARVQLNFDEKFGLNGSQADVLVPLYENDASLLFSQLGVRRTDKRTTGNLGAGFRTFTSDWMLGANSFWDNDFTGHNRRLGVGIEAWRDYLRFSGNNYWRLSDWHQSRDFADYDERPANGYDLRMEGWLPAYPQLGARLMYEHYRGDEVALLGKNNRQKNPWAFSSGVSYTPFPLLTVNAEHRAGKHGLQDSQLNLALSYRMGEAWHKQLDPSAVGATRLLSGSRHDLVERNNHIVLDYRKHQQLTLSLPEKASGKSRSLLPVSFVVKNTHPIQRIDWHSPALTAAGGIITPASEGRLTITLPAWQVAGSNNYTLTGTVYDVAGNSHSATMSILVEIADISADTSSVIATPPAIPANGASTSLITVTLLDKDAKPVTDMASALKMALKQTQAQQQRALKEQQDATLTEVKETSAGVYEAIFTSGTRYGSVVVTPSINGVNLKAMTIELISDNASLKNGDLTVDRDHLPANGTDKATFTALVTNDSHNPLPGIAVSWSSSAGSLSSASSISGADGKATITLSHTVAGEAEVTATLNGAGISKAVTFIADSAQAGIDSRDLTRDKPTAIANGREQITYSAIVKDGSGNLVPNIAVEWATNRGVLTGSNSTTDSDGKATIILSSTSAGEAQVTARVGTQAAINAPLANFTADSGSGQFDGAVAVDKSQIAANGSDKATFSATVKDAGGNLVPDISVSWQTSHGDLSDTISHTNNDGVATVTLSSTVLGNAQVTAVVNGNSANAQPVSFTVDIKTARVVSMQSNKSKLTGTGVERAELTARVEDNQGHLIPNATVNWSSNLGSVNATSQTDSNGQTTIYLIAPVLVAAENAMSTITTTVDGSDHQPVDNQLVEMTAVMQASGKYYWTLSTRYSTDIESTALYACQSRGSADRLLEPGDLSNFGTAAGQIDFSSMRVQGEFKSGYYPLVGSWGSTGAWLSSQDGAGLIGTMVEGELDSGSWKYVCVKNI
ncbi:inverse autotransporter beta domain-containing protein [Erwiniaceae bacterium BAC15a-03b]|uniref:Inverse autotransporter beta domain-containing protein n=1 Tax=Winslowiella arboricola TaxID=2978220 RepID=A0A9J6PY77_9GAMM|nr:inverse autotransporter beta domain-containing protein [Winslowiella arboricola]MCU5772301.1 inverse autotransporter beta domain-containing protein [Winslowiella arboricola]MCU5779820.1 inverse autotransporter beta domain-containing protein [Winslowiella arboricola]